MSFIDTEVTEDEEDVDTEMDFSEMQKMSQKIRHVMHGSVMLAVLAVLGEPAVNKTLGHLELHDSWWWEHLQWLLVVMALLIAVLMCLIDCLLVGDACGCVCIDPILERVFPDSDFLGPFLCLFCVSGVSFAIVFWSTLYVFPYACTYYSATPTSPINTTMPNFTHINCPFLAAPTVTLYGHCGVIAVLWVLYAVNVIKPEFGRETVAELALDFLDLQDFALLLVDDEVLKSHWGVAEDGQGSCWLWKSLMANSLLAFMSIMVQFFFAYRWSNPPSHTDGLMAFGGESDLLLTSNFVTYTPEDDPFTWWDCSMRMLSLGLVEVPFACFRLYVSYAFGIPSSPMLIKNFLSIAKEGTEIRRWRKFPLSELQATLTGEIKE